MPSKIKQFILSQPCMKTIFALRGTSCLFGETVNEITTNSVAKQPYLDTYLRKYFTN